MLVFRFFRIPIRIDFGFFATVGFMLLTSDESLVLTVLLAGKRVQAELETMEKAVQKADEHFTETMKEISTAKAERDKIVEERNAEADYTQALEDAKQGKFAFSIFIIKKPMYFGIRGRFEIKYLLQRSLVHDSG